MPANNHLQIARTRAWPDVLRPLFRGLLAGGLCGSAIGCVAVALQVASGTDARSILEWPLVFLGIAMGGAIGSLLAAPLGVLLAALVLLLRMNRRRRRAWPWYVLHCTLFTIAVLGLPLAVPSIVLRRFVSTLAPSLGHRLDAADLKSPSQDLSLRCLFATGQEIFIGSGRGYLWHRGSLGWERSQEFAQPVNALWGSGPRNVWAVGQVGQLAHYDGRAWTQIPSGVRAHLNAVWGSEPSDVWAVGKTSTIIHYDGQNWTAVDFNGADDLHGIWGSGRADIWAVGERGTILHFDGRSWTQTHRLKTPDVLLAVWGSGPSDVWAAGYDGNVVRFDGKSWKPVHGGPNLLPFGIWGSSPSDILFIGALGSIVHYDGRSFVGLSSGTNEDLIGIWGTSPSNVWVISQFGKILHYDGTAWALLNDS